MKRRILSFALVFILLAGLLPVNVFAADSVRITASVFPDPAFLAYVKSSEVDTDGDGYLNSNELYRTRLQVSRLGIASLQGIEVFYNLQSLNCHNNSLTELDLSGNPLLTSVDCRYNQIASLNLSGCTRLESLYVDENKLTALDVTAFPKLKTLNCDDNQLTVLDLSGNPLLSDLRCEGNDITALDLSNNAKLAIFYCNSNQITALDVSSCPILKDLHCIGNKMESLNVTGCTQMHTLTCRINRLTELDLSTNTALSTLDCSGNDIGELDVSNTVITALDCHGNELTELDVSMRKGLDFLSCYDNRISQLDLTNNTKLTSLQCQNNQLTALDLTVNTAITWLNCTDNPLTVLKIDKITGLSTLYCSNTALTSLKIHANAPVSVYRADNNSYPITLGDDRQFDMTTLPGSFSASKASGFTGGSLSGNILTVEETADAVTYTYDCGAGKTAVFTLVPTVHTHVFDQQVATDDYLVTPGSCQQPNVYYKSCSCGLAGEETFEGALGEHDFHADTAPEYLHTPGNCRNPAVYFVSCSRCGQKGEDTFVSSVFGDHSGGTASCTAAPVCTICGQSYSTSLGHDITSYAAKAPTCDAPGWDAYEECSRCDYSTYVEIPILGHEIIPCDKKDPTCEEPGWDVYDECDRCDYSTYRELPALGHSYVNSVCASCGNVQINVQTFYDPIFREYVSTYFDDDTDGILSLAEREEITEITVNNKGITSLSGLEFFPNLTYLSCEDNALAALDISANRELTTLYCNRNDITWLDVSHNTKLTGLYCSDNLLTELDVRYNTQLLSLSVSGNPLQSLDVSQCRNLAELYCENNQLTVLDVSRNPLLVKLFCGGNDLTVLELSANTALQTLSCKDNRLTSLDIRHCGTFQSLDASGNCYTVAVPESGAFDLTSLPAGFDVTKTSNWTGGSVEGNILTVDPGVSQVTYTYDCGQGQTAAFTLDVTHGHTFREAAEEKHLHTPATCTEAAVYYLSCSCGERSTETFVSDIFAPHTGGTASCTEQAVCAVCRQPYGNILAHDEVPHAGKEPTCLEPGWDAYVTCSRCDYTTYQKLDALGHNEVPHSGKAPTCLEPGWKAYVTCSRCDYDTYEALDALGHDETFVAGQAPTCTLPGWEDYAFCSRCDYSAYRELPETGHDLGYTLSGYGIAENCSRCDHLASASVTAGGTCTGEPMPIRVGSFSAGWLGTRSPLIAYEGLSEPPTEPGSYTALVTFANGKTLTVPFTLIPKGYPVSGLQPGQQVEVDGVKHTADERGILWLSDPDARLLTAFSYGQSDLKDPQGITAHQVYPSTMRVWALTFDATAQSYRTAELTALENIMTYKGTSIRMTGKPGIRIFTAVAETKRAALVKGSLLTGTALEGYKLVEYGTLFKWAKDTADLVYDPAVNNRSVAYGNGTDAVFSRQGGDIWFTGMLVNLQAELCDDELLLRPYMVLENPAGDTLVIHGGTLQRNIGYVAYQNRNFKPNQAAANFIWNIIRAVYGKDFEG